MADFTPKRPSSSQLRARSTEPINTSVLSVTSTATPGTKGGVKRSHSRTVSSCSASKYRKPDFTGQQQSLDESLMSLNSPHTAKAALKEWKTPSKVIPLNAHLQGDDLVDVIEETNRLQHQLQLLKSSERTVWWSESRRVKRRMQTLEAKARDQELAQRAEDWKDAIQLKEMERQTAKSEQTRWLEARFKDEKEAKSRILREKQERDVEDLKRAAEAARLNEMQRKKEADAEREAAQRLREERKEAALAAKRSRDAESKRKQQDLSLGYSQRTCTKLKEVILETEKAVRELNSSQVVDSV